jgi:hypothetical protein
MGEVVCISLGCHQKPTVNVSMAWLTNFRPLQ